MGIYLSVFSKNLNSVSKIEVETIKTGFQGTLGNKGGALLSFYYEDSRIVVCNCHLTSGNKKCNERLQDIQEIHAQSKLNVFQSDFLFLFGDLNFRLTSGYHETVH